MDLCVALVMCQMLAGAMAGFGTGKGSGIIAFSINSLHSTVSRVAPMLLVYSIVTW